MSKKHDKDSKKLSVFKEVDRNAKKDNIKNVTSYDDVRDSNLYLYTKPKLTVSKRTSSYKASRVSKSLEMPLGMAKRMTPPVHFVTRLSKCPDKPWLFVPGDGEDESEAGEPCQPQEESTGSVSQTPKEHPSPRLLFSSSPYYDPLKLEEDPQKLQDQIWLKTFKLTPTHLVELKEIYALYEEKPGYPAAKFGVALRALGQNPTEKQIQQLLLKAEFDHSSGFMNFEEFIHTFSMYNYQAEQDMLDNLTLAFQSFDRAGTGLIHIDVFKEALTTLGEPIEDLPEFVKEANVNADGFFNYFHLMHKMAKR